MKLVYKIVIGIVAVAVITAGSFLLLSNNTVKADDNVDMRTFNALEKRVEALELQLIAANEKITDLTNADTVINESIDKITTDITTLKKSDSGLAEKVNTNISKIDKLYLWHDKLYELQSYKFPNNLGGYALDHIWKQMYQYGKVQ